MKVVKLKSLDFRSREEFQLFKAGVTPFGLQTWLELEEKLGHRLDAWNKIQGFVKVGKRWKSLRAKVRQEDYHCQCGSCDPTVHYYVVPSGQTGSRVSAA